MPDPRASDDEILECAAVFEEGSSPESAEAWSLLSESDRQAFALLEAVARLGAVEGATAPSAPKRWGGYEILGRQGSGSFGEVYRAYDGRLDRLVALKLHRTRHDAHGPSQARQAMLREGRLLARLDHPNVVRVHAAEEHDGTVGLVMALVDGETLAEAVSTQPLPIREAVRVAQEVSRALGALHRARIVHRDVKAQNILRRRDGRVVLIDFGIGLDLDSLDAEATLSGTPLYLAPELLEGATPTPRSDLYSLGVLLYHLLSGHFPVEAETVSDLRTRLSQRSRVPLRQRRSGMPRRLERLVEACLATDPSQRPASAEEVEAVCTALLRPTWQRLARRAAVAVAGLLVAAGLALVWAQSRADPVTTSSELARSYYAFGEAANRHGFQGLALRFAERAIEEDSTFASGYALAALAASGEGRRDEAHNYATAAGLFAARLDNEAETYQVATVSALVQGDYASCLAAALELRRLRPQATLYLRQGVQAAQQLGHFAQGLELQQEILEDTPTPNDYGQLVSLLVDLGRIPEAFVAQAEGERRFGREPYLAWVRGVIELARGGDGAAREAFARLATAHDLFLADAGRAWLDELALVAALRSGTAPEPAPSLRSRYWADRVALNRARWHAATGDPDPLRQLLSQLGPNTTTNQIRTLGRLAAELGDPSLLERARALLPDQAERRSAEHAGRLQLGAERARLAGRPAEAAALLDQAEQAWWPDLELSLSRRNLQGSSPTLCSRRGEFLNSGSWLEYQQRCEQPQGL